MFHLKINQGKLFKKVSPDPLSAKLHGVRAARRFVFDY